MGAHVDPAITRGDLLVADVATLRVGNGWETHAGFFTSFSIVFFFRVFFLLTNRSSEVN